MKKRLGIIFVLLVLMATLTALCAVNASAEDAITVTYNWYSGGVWETAKPNDDGTYTLRSDKKSGNGTIELADGTVVDKEFYGWFDQEGNQYAPGATVTFTKSTRLYEAYGVTVDNAADLKKMNGWQDSTYVKLGADITLDTNLSSEWCTRVIDLNGHNITNTSRESAIYVKRGALVILGEGKISHVPENPHTSADKGFVWFDGHGYGDDGNPQLCWIGKDVEVETPYNLLYENGRGKDNMPNMVIAGKVTARSLMRVNPTLVNATCYIASTAVINVSTNLFEFKNLTGTSKYMTVTLDGTINVANGASDIFTDFALEKIDFVINGGKYCVTKNDVKNIGYYLSDDLMIKETTEEGTTWYEIVLSDCAHNWIKNEEKSVAATADSFGSDVFGCDLCGREKSVVTVYDPSNSEIIITVVDENGEKKDVTVKAGDVLSFVVTGVGDKTRFSFIGVKGNEEYPATSIVAVEIPVGVTVLSTTESNGTLDTINIGDGVDINVVSLNGMTALKTINIGAAKVKFESTKNNTSLESIISNVAGAEVVFGNNCFDGKSNIKYLTMSNGSSYSFGAYSFRKTGVETVVFPDEATVTFPGEAAFYNAATKYVYFGKSITNIPNKPFDCANNLETVVLMGETLNITQYTFCVAGANNSTSVLSVYCHAGNVTIDKNTFINRQNNGVVFYTIDPDITSLQNCKNTVYNGIPHAYTQNIIKEPSCVETGVMGYVTDCACGVASVTTYTVYADGTSTEGSTAESEIPVSGIHVAGETLADIEYKNGLLNKGVKSYYCADCNEAIVVEEEASANAIFKYLGYSVSTYGKFDMLQGYYVDKGAYNDYTKLHPTFKFGTVAAYNATGEAMQPLNIVDNKVQGVTDKVIVGDFVLGDAYCFQIRLKGVADEFADKTFIFCAYVFDGEKVVYISDGVEANSVVGTTYNSINN